MLLVKALNYGSGYLILAVRLWKYISKSYLDYCFTIFIEGKVFQERVRW